ncbi:MAG TPA: DUF2163 domain-containing protein [Phycisphaerae bacterium]|nr:DUF2163 domain-containing protein [Phycisphaerae bacterium]
MKQLISAALAARLASDNLTTLAHCWKLQARDGLLLHHIAHDETKTVALGLSIDGTYTHTPGGTTNASRQAVDIAGDGMSLEGLLETSDWPYMGPRERDLRAKRFAGAEFWHFSYDWLNEDGIIPHSAGTLGNIEIRRGIYVAEVRRLTSYFANTIGEPYLGECPAQAGGPRCKLRIFSATTPNWTAAATADLRLDQDEAGVVKGDASLAPFAKLTVVRPVDVAGGGFLGRDFKASAVVAPGATGGGEPVWPTVIGNTVVDNDVTWEAIQSRRWECRVTAVTNQRTLVVEAASHHNVTGPALMTAPANLVVLAFGSAAAQAGDAFYFDADGPEAATRVASGGGSLTLAEPYRGINAGIASATTLQADNTVPVAIDAPDDWFGAGIAQFRTGDNRVYPVEIDTWTLSSATLTLQYGLPFTVQVGEHIVLHAGCRGRREDCRDKFENIANNRAEYDVPTRLVVFVDAKKNT